MVAARWLQAPKRFLAIAKPWRNLAWIEATFAPAHVILFEQGGHLGNLGTNGARGDRERARWLMRRRTFIPDQRLPHRLRKRLQAQNDPRSITNQILAHDLAAI